NLAGRRGERWLRGSPRGGRGSRAAESEEILEEPRALLGQDALGMELHTPGLVLAMLESHDLAFGRPGDDFERWGQTLTPNQERVIARGRKGILEPGEQAAPLMNDLARLAVQDALGAHDLAAVHEAQTLMSETHAQDRHLSGEALDHVVGHAGLARCLGSR